ncbi:MAG TPA: leucyl/phenylalanyl-tRNA--protein transferase [Sphingobacteriaceae bacterium]
MIYQLDEEEVWFPDPAEAEEDGFLAVGGDLSPGRLILAYHHGIFPWYSDETPILWYSPHERFVLFPSLLKVSKSMRQVLRNAGFSYTFDRCFEEVIEACSVAPRPGQDGTWITSDMKEAYTRLHRLGAAHSVEVWKDGELIGGLYGVMINRVFCGESMFSRVSNASKAALIWLCGRENVRMVDCQFHTTHLESMGGRFISRAEYLDILSKPD